MNQYFGKYQVLERVGEGGFGQVYRGRDPDLSRDVAIKTVSMAAPQARERFPREAAIAAGLRHPAIVTIYDFGEQDDTPYLVQEYLPGEDLASRIARRDAGDLATRLHWLRQVADGLHYAHGKGVIHRDIKPGNVRILDDGTVRVMDFGIAKVLDSTTRLTGTNVSLGTSGYVAPEQLEGRPIDARADMFAFGVMAYELVTYERPFEADTVSATLYRILTADPVPIARLAPDCPPRLATCIDRCLRKRREERFADMHEVDAELAAVLADMEAEAVRETTIAATMQPLPPIDSTVALPSKGASSAGSVATPPTPVREAAGTGGQKAFLAVAALLLIAATAWAVTATVGVVRGGRDGPAGTSSTVVAGDPDDLAVPAGTMDSTEQVTVIGDSAVGATADAAGVASAPAEPAGSVVDPRSTSGPPAGATRTAGDERTTTRAGESGSGQQTRAVAADSAVRVAPPPVTGPAPQVDANRVLVLVSGERPDAVSAAQSIVLSALLTDGRTVVDPDAVDAIRADAAAFRALQAGGTPAAEIGREYGAGVVVVAVLSTDASPAPGGFVTGTAVLTAKFYDSDSGALLFLDTYRVGAGTNPGRPGATETAAVTQAAESVARQLVRAILTRTGG